MPPDWLALKGRDKPLDAEAEANAWLLRPGRACFPVKDAVSFETQAVGLGFVSSPLRGSNHSQLRIKYAQSLEGRLIVQKFCDTTLADCA